MLIGNGFIAVDYAIVGSTLQGCVYSLCLGVEVLLVVHFNLSTEQFQIVLNGVHDSCVVVDTVGRILIAAAYAYELLAFERTKESFSLGYVVTMVDIENLVDGVSFELQAFGYELTLEVAHTAHALLHTVVEYVESTVAQTVNTARYKIVSLLLAVVKTCYARHAVRALLVENACTVGIHLLLNAYPQWLLVINKRCDSHTSVYIGSGSKVAYVFLEFCFAEDGIYRCKTKTFATQIWRKRMQAVH